jgi:signal peptidase I
MVPEDSNEFFEHLNQPATPRRIRKPSSSQNQRPGDFSSVPDPFGEEGEIGPDHPLATSGSAANLPERGRARSRSVKGPGLSPGIPQAREDRPPTREMPRSGVVLTPSGVKRVDDDPPQSPSALARKVASVPEPEPQRVPEDFHTASRERNDQDDVSWEEYAADGFPAMAAEEFGVKVKTTDSGRVVPVGVRADLTDEALKGKSIKDKAGTVGRKPKPAPKPAGPKSFWGKVGDSLRLSKPVLEEEEDETDSAPESKPAKGFARSGSQKGKGGGGKTKKTPLGMAWSVVVEVAKILMLVLLLRAYVVQVSQVQGPSMEGTLEQDDRLIVERVTPLLVNNQDKWWVNWMPDFLTPELERGDIIVIRSPEDPGAELVKRLIALPGDTLKFEDGKLFLKADGAAEFAEVKEDYLSSEELKNPDGTFRAYSVGDLGDFIEEGDEIVVPSDRIFVMGDNRTHSNDSRRWLEINVKRTEPPGIDRLWLHKSSVEGRVIFRIWPFNRTWPPVK